MRLILLTCLATALALISFRSIQSFTVHGKITDDQSNALTGVSVTEKGTSNSVITDSKGEFVIMISPKSAEKKPIKNQRILSILLEELPLKQAVKIASRITEENKNTLYQTALNLQCNLRR